MVSHSLPPLQPSSDLLAYYCYLTPAISDQINNLSACQTALELLSPLPNIEHELRRTSLLKSSLYSARIEGNPLTLSDVQPMTGGFEATNKTGNNRLHNREIQNLQSAYTWVSHQPIPTSVSIQWLKHIHAQVMQGLSPESGQFRSEESAIFNSAGLAVYLTPSPTQIHPQLTDLCQWLANPQAQSAYPPVLQAVIAHYIFEKIHPFLDGNGRVGRLMLFHLLHQANLSLRGLLVVERVLDERRQSYYDCLAPTRANCTTWVEFMTECLAEAAQTALEQLKPGVVVETVKKKGDSPADHLLPRRQEILAIIKDHHLVSFDFIARRFASVPKSSLHYDLKYLLNQGLVQKLGKTRGALYEVKKIDS